MKNNIVKPIFAVLCVFIWALLFSACNSNSDTDTNESIINTEETSESTIDVSIPEETSREILNYPRISDDIEITAISDFYGDDFVKSYPLENRDTKDIELKSVLNKLMSDEIAGGNFYKIGTDIPSGKYVAFSDYGFLDKYSTLDDCINNDKKEAYSGYKFMFVDFNSDEYVYIRNTILAPFEEIEIRGLSNFGIYVVGEDIQPGEYELTTVSQHDNGYCRVYDDFSEQNFIDEYNFSNNKYITVNEDDIIFLKNIKAYAPKKNVVQYESNVYFEKIYPDGHYRVGIDIPEGVYVICNSSSSIASLNTGKTSNVYDSTQEATFTYAIIDNFEYGEYVDISDNSYIVPFDTAYSKPNEVVDIYKAGTDIDVGTYEVIISDAKRKGYYSIYSDLDLSSQIDHSYFELNDSFTVNDGQYLVICKATLK